MIVRDTVLTPALQRWLEQARDDDQPPLQVRQVGSDIEVLRPGGATLSETERVEVTALLAAHSVEPLR